jgi:diguanylate cyclase (GGDEF)-like protein
MRPHWRYTGFGVLLGLGAPLGSLALRFILTPKSPLEFIAAEWHAAAFYYVYMTFATVAVFGIFGFLVGRRNEDLSDLSVTDGLTGVFNHRYLHEQLRREIERADRHQANVTCLMLDIDDFKKVNDLHGHPFGDEVLAVTAQIIRESVRQIDIVGRYGGEEFLVIMPQTKGADAVPIAERIGKSLEAHVIHSAKGDVRVTLSIGLASYPEPMLGVKTKSALLSAADQALYKAKRAGKNRTVVWQP